MPQLSPTQRRELRARAHHLHPVVSIAGNGLTDAVLTEIDRALKAHELIKIRVYGDDREIRGNYLDEICLQLHCESVQSIGKLLVVFRAQAPAAKTVVRAENAAKHKRPARPATARPPRMALRGQDVRPRQRKATAGSTRPRKSAR